VTFSGLVLSCGGPAISPSEDKYTRFLAAGDTASAIRHIEKAQYKRKQDPNLYLLLGRLHRERGTINGRLRSQQVLERGLQLFPDHADVLIELAKTYFAQTFYPDAVRYFKLALDVDPDLCEAHSYIGLYHYNNWKRVNDYTDDLTAARRHFSAAVSCDSSELFSTVKLGFSLYALDRHSEAEELCDSAVERFPDAPDFFMLRGAIAYNDKRFDDASDDFRRGLVRMDEDLRTEYADLFDLLAYEERFLYREAHDVKREVVERSYWIDLDPDPTTEINERHLEHLYRMFIADLYFSCYRPPIRGWRTERGEAVVKFGWPWQITSTLGDSWDSGRIEKWYYIDRHKMRQFVFEDEYLSGNLRIPIYADSMVFVLRFGPRASSYVTETTTIPGAMDVVVFKDDEFSGTMYITARIDADSLQNVVDLGKVNRFHFRGALFDDEWVADSRFADTLWTTDVETAREGRTSFYFIARDVSLPFDSYHVACAFEDEYGTARSLFKGNGDSYRFTEGGLSVSDILLQHDPLRGAGSFTRGERRFSPNPGHVYSDGQRLVIYFEIYDLRMVARRTEYEVTFHIYESPDPEGKPSRWRELGRRITGIVGIGRDRNPAISQTIRRQGYGFSSAEDMIINIDALDDGRYELVVSVSDRISGERTHSASVFFKTGVGDR
jgi:GWxTD domain-containing protein